MTKGMLAFDFVKKNIRYIVAGFCGLIIVVGTSIGLHAYRKQKADRTVRVAFYGLSDDVVNMFKEAIPKEEKIFLVFDVISDGDFDTAIVRQKYDMLFTWRGDITEALSASAEDIPQKVLEAMPNSLRNKKCVPILLDHCEFAFNSEVFDKLKVKTELPSSYKAFNDFLNNAKDVVFSPFFCNGAEDRIIVDFVGALVMAKGGLNAYNKLIEVLKNADALDDVIDIPLDGKNFTLRSVLDELKQWPKEGFTHPAWFTGTASDLLYFASDKQLACFFTLLSEHRKFAYNVIKNYESSFVPTNKGAENYGLIAPSISVMLLSDNANCKRYIAGFFTEDAQADFSNKTRLAPVQYRAQAYDRQSDDVRFWAASCAGGAVPDIYNAVYQRKSKELEKLCTEIRGYVR